jgi:DNA-binding NarL/FixJ family response regulator
MDGSARKKLRVLILDDHATVQRGLRRILAERFLEFGESEAGPEGLDLALGQPWDLVIIATDLPRLVSAVRRVLADTTSRPSTLVMGAQPDLKRRRGRLIHKNLSKRESEVLRLIGLGKTVKEIASLLALSETTVSTYRSRILIKLGLRTNAELVRYAVTNRIAD